MGKVYYSRNNSAILAYIIQEGQQLAITGLQKVKVFGTELYLTNIESILIESILIEISENAEGMTDWTPAQEYSLTETLINVAKISTELSKIE